MSYNKIHQKIRKNLYIMNKLIGAVLVSIIAGVIITYCLNPLIELIIQQSRGFPISLQQNVTAAAPSKDIVLGISTALTGPSQELGKSLLAGAQLYFNDINQKGGIHGQRIKLVIYDDHYNPIPAVRNTIKLIKEDKVDMLFGYVGTPTVTRMLPLLKKYEDQKIYLMFPFTGAEPQRHHFPYGQFAYNLRASYLQETKGLVDHFIKVNRKRIAVFYQADSYGRNGWIGVKTALDRYGYSISGEATYRRGDSFEASYKKHVDIIHASRPETIICIGSYQACGGFIRDYRNNGDHTTPIANISFVGSESLLKLLKKYENESGKKVTNNIINSQVVPDPWDQSLPAVQEYHHLLKNNPKLKPSFVGFEGFLNAKLLTIILKKIDKPFHRSQLSAVIESMHRINLGLNIPLSFATQQHQASQAVYYFTIKEGRFRQINDWKAWIE